MPCNPNDNTLNPIIPPPPGIPGFGPPFAPIGLPLSDFDLPTDLIEDLVDLINSIGALFPSGLFKPNLDFGMKSVLDAIASILNQIAPFLSFYNFIIAALRLIVCIIEVLCAIPNPFAVASKLKVLFTECLPPFLNLFPFLALIAMILSLLLLILALIQYLIEKILAIITAIIRNLEILANGIALQDADATLAAAQKIASLLCFIENMLAIFIAIAAILAIIQSLAQLAGFGVCSDEDTEGCCPPEICPPFIKENSEIFVTNGELVYYSRIGADLDGIGLPASLLPLLSSAIVIREERWQLFDTDATPDIPISSIIAPTSPVFFGGQNFYPDQSFLAETPPTRAPYTVDMTLEVDPAAFGHIDILGSRIFQIKDCIVVRKPYIGLITYNNQPSINNIAIPVDNGSTGTLNIEGGLVYEEDGETPYEIGGEQATLNTFISLSAQTSTDFPVSDDGYTIENVEFVWKPNHPALASYDLITVGCIPEVNVEKAAQNAILAAEGIDSVFAKLQNAPDGALVPSVGPLPNVTGASECIQNAIDVFRQDVSIEGAAAFQSTVETCLGDLRDQTTAVYCDALINAVSQFKSTATIDVDVQFISRDIQVTVILRDGAGTVISNDIPDECLPDILSSLNADVSFGTISDFEYDGYNGAFIASISAETAGAGDLTVSFGGNIFSTVTAGTSFTNATTIEETITSFAFVADLGVPIKKRDEVDVASDGA